MDKDLVLIVDDDHAVRTMLCKIMDSNGFNVVQAESGPEALKAVSENSFALILLDINMHGMDGFEVINEIRSRGMNVPIMVVSGRKADYDTLYGLDIGADEYITKPFNPVTLGAKAKGGSEETNIPLELKDEIQYEDFEKLDLRVGTILSAEKHPKADKLLVFQVKMGTETRQIVSGVAEHFKPEECVGQKVVVVANLKPRKLRGLESKGMILFADNVVDGKERVEFVTSIADDGNPVT